MLPNEAVELRMAVENLVQAEINMTWAGSGDPNDIEIIKKNLQDSRDKFNNLVALLQIPLKEDEV